MNFYLADTHFFHANVICFNRHTEKFSSVEEMNQTIINNWNSVVSKNDNVYLVGDECWLKGNDKRWEEVFSTLKGNIFLIRGNHSLSSYPANLKKYFCDIKDYMEITDYVNNIAYHVILCHYPIICFKNDNNPFYIMIHGHTHYYTNEAIYMREQIKEIKNKYVQYPDNRGQIFNVGACCPWMDYTPKSLKELIIMNDKGMILQ